MLATACDVLKLWVIKMRFEFAKNNIHKAPGCVAKMSAPLLIKIKVLKKEVTCLSPRVIRNESTTAEPLLADLQQNTQILDDPA